MSKKWIGGLLGSLALGAGNAMQQEREHAETLRKEKAIQQAAEHMAELNSNLRKQESTHQGMVDIGVYGAQQQMTQADRDNIAEHEVRSLKAKNDAEIAMRRQLADLVINDPNILAAATAQQAATTRGELLGGGQVKLDIDTINSLERRASDLQATLEKTYGDEARAKVQAQIDAVNLNIKTKRDDVGAKLLDMEREFGNIFGRPGFGKGGTGTGTGTGTGRPIVDPFKPKPTADAGEEAGMTPYDDVAGTPVDKSAEKKEEAPGKKVNGKEIVSVANVWATAKLNKPAVMNARKQFEYDINKYAKDHGVDGRLLTALGIAESELNPEAKSKKGAAGPFQFMEGTGGDKRFGLVLPDGTDLRKDWDASGNAAAKYISILTDMFDEYGENTPWLAVGAYNAGEGHMQEWLEEAKAKGLDPANMSFEQLLSVIKFPETRSHMARIKALYPSMSQISEYA